MAIPQERASHWPLTVLMGLSSLLNLFLPLVLVRLLSPEQVGQYKFFFLCVATAPWFLLSSGFINGLYYWVGQKDRCQEALEATWSYQLLWSAGVLLLGLLTAPWVAGWQNFWAAESKFYWFFIGSVAFGISAQFFEESQIAKGRARQAAWYGASWEFLRTFSLIAAALLWRNLESLIYLHLAIIFLKFLVSTTFAVRKARMRFHLWQNPERRAVLRYALPVSGAAAFAVILGYFDQFLLGHFLSAEAFALYALGCLAIPPLLILEQSVNKLMIPALSQALISADPKPWRLVRQAIQELSLWLIPASVGLFFFAKPIVHLLFTEKYSAATTYLQLFCWSYAFYIIPFDCWARAQGKSEWILRTMALFSGVSIALTALGLHFAGARGALTGFLATQFLLRAYGLFQMRARLQWRLLDILPLQALGRHLAVSLLLGFLLSSFQPVFSSSTVGLVVLGGLFWLLYVAASVPWTLKKERQEESSKNVLMLTQYLHVGGLERMILNLSQVLKDKSSWHPSVLVYDQIPGSENLDESFQEVPLTRLLKPSGVSLKLAWQIARHCRKNHIDLIHAHDLGALIYASLAKIFSLGRLRVIFTQHSFVHLKKGQKYSFYEKVFTRLSDKIVTVSEALRQTYISMGLDSKKIQVIENGIPLSEQIFDKEQKIKMRSNLIDLYGEKLLPHKNWIICLARLHPGKGQTEILQIWKALDPQIRQQSQILFVGSETSVGYRAELEKQSATLPQADSIIFVGATNRPLDWLGASDLFVSASHEEGLPLSPLEAVSVGLPLLLSDIPGHEFFKNVSEFFTLSDLSIAAMKTAAILAGNLPFPRAELLHNQNALLARYSVQRMMREYVEIYESDK